MAMGIAIALVVLLGIVILLVVVLGLYGVVTYNGLIRLRNLTQEAWRQVDVELNRRHDLIPNLVETVKGYASHERGTLEDVTRARAAATAPAASVAEQSRAEGELSQALGRLLAISEAYPDLKANQNFLALQAELSQTEDRIASGRRYYNATVRELNTKVESVPSNIVAGFAHIGRADYFEVEDEQVRSAPQVSFGDAAPRGGTGPASVSSGREPGAPPLEAREPGAPATAPAESGAPDYGSPPRA